MRFLMILDSPEIARYVCAHEGVIPFVDLEVMGKAERQGHRDTWMSQHTTADVTRIREAVPEAHLVVRINPLHDGSQAEIDTVIARGADSVMLPMFTETDELARFLDMLGGRAQALPLFETAKSVRAIPQMVRELDLRQLHIGLNDLHLDLGMLFMFQPLADGLLEAPAEAMRAAGVSFGIGGLARAQEGIVSPEYLLGEHVRLGSTAAILSRTFHRGPKSLQELKDSMDFGAELDRLRAIYNGFAASDASALEKNRVQTHDRIADVVRLIKSKRGDT